MPDKKQELLKTLATLDDERLLKKDFVSAFEHILKIILNKEEQLSEAVSRLEETYKMLLKRVGDEHTQTLSDLKGQVNDVFVGDQIKRIDHESKTSHAEMKGIMTATMKNKMDEMEYEHQEYKKDIEEIRH